MLSELAEILKPIHEAQKMSESNSATLGKVIPRWLGLKEDLKGLSKLYPYLDPILTSEGTFDKRFGVQTSDIHWAAFLLDPTSYLQSIDFVSKDLAKNGFLIMFRIREL